MTWRRLVRATRSGEMWWKKFNFYSVSEIADHSVPQGILCHASGAPRFVGGPGAARAVSLHRDAPDVYIFLAIVRALTRQLHTAGG